MRFTGMAEMPNLTPRRLRLNTEMGTHFLSVTRVVVSYSLSDYKERTLAPHTTHQDSMSLASRYSWLSGAAMGPVSA